MVKMPTANSITLPRTVSSTGIGFALFSAALAPTTALADDKSQYTLFNPTPRNLMRAMSTDRPDKTESPFTVDAGHFQFEMDLVSYSYDRHNPDRQNIRAEAFSVTPVNLKVGLLNNVDLQVIIEPYLHTRTHDLSAGTVEKRHGFGDTFVRTKINLWGNDGGQTALAIMPYVKIPTNQNDLGNNSVEGGVMVPFGAELPGGWGMGLMTQVDIIRDATGGGHHPEFINTVTFGHGITRKLAGYVEFFSLVSTESGSGWVGTVDTGLTYAVTENIQLDCGVNIGVTRSAEDWNPFVGLSWRF